MEGSDLHSRRATIHNVESFPNIGGMSDEELRNLLKKWTDEEMEVSFVRRILRGKMDIVRAELRERERREHSGGDEMP